MSIRKEIAKNILYYRKKYGYTQKQLGELLGVRNSSVSNWENEENSIDIETLLKLCKIFNVSLNDMYGTYGVQNNYTSHEKAVIEAYRNKPEMQPAIDKILGIENNDTSINDDIVKTVNEIKFPIKQK